MGLDVYLKKGALTIEEPSTKHPEHMFQRGYFRSSYNGSGFNSVMHAFGIATLDTVFQAPNDGGNFTPDWEACLTRAKAALEAYTAIVNGPGGKGRVSFISADKGEAKADSDRMALAVYRDEASREQPFPSYSNKAGHFFFDGLTVKAVIPGTQRWGGAGVYLIWEPEEADGENWYAQAWEVVIETCEWVIATGNPGDYGLYWSA